MDMLVSGLPYLVNGVALGLNVSLVALVLALVWRTAGMIDFGLGASYLVSGYACVGLHTLAGLPLPVSMLIAVILGSACSVVLYRCLYRYFIRRGAPIFILVLVALSAFIAVESLASAAFTAQKHYLVDELLAGWEVLGTRINVAQLGKMLAALAALAVISAFCTRTRLGVSILAVADNAVLARGVGIDTDRTYTVVFAIAGMTAGIAAIPDVVEIGIDPYAGFNPVFLGLAALIVGGMQDFKGPVLGAVLLGVAFHLAVWVFSSQWQEVVAYGLVIAVLLVRPQGLFGGVAAFEGRA